MSEALRRRTILVLCTGNARRSQMAEGLIRHECGDVVTVYSAGTNPSSLHPTAVIAMREIGIDISGQRSKHVREIEGDDIDEVITLCDAAQADCPAFPHAVRARHMSFADPATTTGSDEAVLDVFRQVREDMRRRLLPVIRNLIETE